MIKKSKLYGFDIIASRKEGFAVAIERGSYRGDDRLCRGSMSLSKAEDCSIAVTPAWVGHDGVSL